MEFKKLKATQEEMMWNRKYTQEVLEPAIAKGREVSFSELKKPRTWADAKSMREGPDYTSKQVQDYFDGKIQEEMLSHSINEMINRATKNINDWIDSPVGQKGTGAHNIPTKKPKWGKQAGVAQPDLFLDVLEGAGKETAALVRDALREVPKAGKDLSSELLSARRPILMPTPGSEKLFTGDVVEKLGFATSMNWLRGIAEKSSPTMVKMLDKFDRRLMGHGRMEGATFNETHKMRLADFSKDIKNAYAPLRPREYGKYGGVSKANDRMLGEFMRGIRSEAQTPKAVVQTARNIRKVLDKYHSELVNANIKGLSDTIDYLRDYVPRDYAKVPQYFGVKAKEQLWMDTLAKHGFDEKTAKGIWNHLRTHESTYKVNAKSLEQLLTDNPNVSRRSFIDYDRLLKNIPDKELAPFLNPNMFDTLMKYGRQYAHRRTFGEYFGANREIFRSELMQAAKEMEAAGNPMPKYIAERLYNIVNAIDHTYNPLENVSYKNLQKGAMSATNLALLPLVTMSSAPEVWVPMSKVGIANFAKTMPITAITQAKRLARRIYKDMPKDYREKIFEGTSAAMDMASQERMMGLFSGDFSAVDSAFFKMTGLHHFTKFTKQSAVNNFITQMEGTLKKVKKTGKVSARDQQLFDYYGIEPKEGIAWLDAGKPVESAFGRKMVRGALRFSEDVVLTPNPATVPMWFSDPRYAYIRHLKTFPSMMYTRVLEPWMESIRTSPTGYGKVAQATNVTTTLAAMVATAFVVNELQDLIKYGEAGAPYEKTPLNQTVRALGRVGLTGPGDTLREAMLLSKYGLFGAVSPSLSLGVEAIDTGKDWVFKDDSKQLAKFIARNASIFGRIEDVREPMQMAIEDFLNQARDMSGLPPKGTSSLKSIGD